MVWLGLIARAAQLTSLNVVSLILPCDSTVTYVTLNLDFFSSPLKLKCFLFPVELFILYSVSSSLYTGLGELGDQILLTPNL